MITSLFHGLLLAAVLIAPQQAASDQQTTSLTIQAHDDARQGEPHETTIVLTDARGRPLAGETVTVLEELRMFTYVDTVPIAELRTDFRGAATVRHTPSAAGTSRMVAEYGGSEAFAPASASVPFTVAPGVGIPTAVIPMPDEPILPRGVTAAWFLPLLVGVWLALSVTVYHVVRISREGPAHEESG